MRADDRRVVISESPWRPELVDPGMRAFNRRPRAARKLDHIPDCRFGPPKLAGQQHASYLRPIDVRPDQAEADHVIEMREENARRFECAPISGHCSGGIAHDERLTVERENERDIAAPETIDEASSFRRADRVDVARIECLYRGLAAPPDERPDDDARLPERHTAARSADPHLQARAAEHNFEVSAGRHFARQICRAVDDGPADERNIVQRPHRTRIGVYSRASSTGQVTS